MAHIVRTLPARLRMLCASLDLGPGDTVVDYGCADQPYRDCFAAGVRYVGADIAGNERADVELTPAGGLPLADGSADAVISTQVLEHVTDPGHYLAECARVLRPRGQLLLSTHGMMLYHPDPDDYWRWTRSGLEKIITDAGFEVVRVDPIVGLAASALQFLQDAVYGWLPHPLQHALAFVMQPLVAAADRFEPQSVREHNALVYALVARRD